MDKRSDEELKEKGPPQETGAIRKTISDEELKEKGPPPETGAIRKKNSMLNLPINRSGSDPTSKRCRQENPGPSVALVRIKNPRLDTECYSQASTIRHGPSTPPLIRPERSLACSLDYPDSPSSPDTPPSKPDPDNTYHSNSPRKSTPDLPSVPTDAVQTPEGENPSNPPCSTLLDELIAAQLQLTEEIEARGQLNPFFFKQDHFRSTSDEEYRKRAILSPFSNHPETPSAPPFASTPKTEPPVCANEPPQTPKGRQINPFYKPRRLFQSNENEENRNISHSGPSSHRGETSIGPKCLSTQEQKSSVEQHEWSMKPSTSKSSKKRKSPPLRVNTNFQEGSSCPSKRTKKNVAKNKEESGFYNQTLEGKSDDDSS